MNEELTSIEYAASAPTIPPELIKVAQRLVVLSVLSGLCVAVCFSSLILGPTVGNVLHGGVFAITVVQAVYLGLSIQRLTGQPIFNRSSVADGVALSSLALFGVAPILTHGWRDDKTLGCVMSIVFFGLAMTSWRHVWLYRMLANYCRVSGMTRRARGMTALGWFKAIYETIWLGCCFATALFLAGEWAGLTDRNGAESLAIFPAFGALLGCAGFGGVWLWMMIAHAFLLSGLNRAALATRAQSAFAVVMPEEIPMASAALPADRHVEVLDH